MKTGLIQHAAQPRFCYQEVHFVTKKYSFWDICFLTAPFSYTDESTGLSSATVSQKTKYKFFFDQTKKKWFNI